MAELCGVIGIGQTKHDGDAQGRLDAGPRARGGGARARGRRAAPGRTSTPS